MKQLSAAILCLTLTSVCYAQVTDDFGDGDFTNNPSWTGSSSQFIVNSTKQLQLSATTAGQSYLSTPFSLSSLADVEWQIFVKQSFSPSATNYSRIYLVSDQSDLTKPLNGYYLQFGESLANDAIELFHQTGSVSTSICRGTNGAIASSFTVRVKVNRDNTGLWTLFVDYKGGTNFIQEASGSETTLNTSTFFGVRCNYTVSNAAKFFYDDIAAGPTTVINADTTPPSVGTVQINSSTTLSLTFSEPIDKRSAEMTSNYSADNSLGNPSSATLEADGKTVDLSFSNPFVNGIQNQLTISNVKDVAGNVMSSATLPFMFFLPVPANAKDVIITEIFADPSPQVGLPAQEYVEIHNRSASPFDLSGWKFSDGTSTATFGTQIILPQQYWILCSSSNASLFANYGNVIGVTNFPTLNNGGDALTLRDADEKTIDSVNYSLEWYHDIDKQEGGWSMEIIDVDNNCGEEENWTASEDPSGGTPGKQNSVFANKPDLTGPKLLSVSPATPLSLHLTFDEKLEKDISMAQFTIAPSILVSKIYFTDQSLRQISLELSDSLLLRELYTIAVTNLTDCAGNFIQGDFSQLSFALPEEGDSLDIIVNEILFNPKSGGVDFVEMYNNSPKYINLKNWKLGNYDSASIKKPSTISTTDFILRPFSYLVFTSDPAELALQYLQANQNSLTKADMPSLPDDAGSIAIANDQGLLIDHFTYSEKMHSLLLKDTEGVSLERISFSEQTNDADNWKSANASVGYASPGFVNSNSRPEPSVNENTVSVDPEVFSPSAPGKDFSMINYKFDRSGMAANVRIRDIQGRLIKTLANNETLGYEGFFRWDGDRDDGTQARVGYYLVCFEVFDLSGFVSIFRKRAVIGK